MSRGLGKIERAILRTLDENATVENEDRDVPLMGTRDLYFAVYVDAPWEKPRAKYNALTRALRTLERKGEVASAHVDGRRIWTDTRGTRDLEELLDQFPVNLPT